MTFLMIFQHIYMVLCAMIMVILLGVPLGICAYMKHKSTKFIFLIVDILQTIPTLALFGLLMIIFGANALTVIIGLTIYSLLPIVQNTYAGLSEVPSSIKEAATAMGMKMAVRLKTVELPLALPMIITGIKIAAINSIGVAVFAVFVGAGGLGSVFYNAIRTQDITSILFATVTLIILSALTDFSLNALEKKFLKRSIQ